MYLLDTNICIYFMKNTYPQLTQRLLSHHPSELLISSVTVFELEYGASKSNAVEKNRQNLAMFLAPFTVLPFDTDDAITAGRLRADLAQRGTPIGPYDLQIASQAVSKGLIMVTHNTGEFIRVPNIRLEDWVV